MNKYLRLIKAGTKYSDKMDRLSRSIFGDVVRKTNDVSMKVVKRLSEKPFYEDPSVVNYYPRHREVYTLMCKLRGYGLYRDEHEDYKDEMRRLRRLRGKVAPKKGEGKQQILKKGAAGHEASVE